MLSILVFFSTAFIITHFISWSEITFQGKVALRIKFNPYHIYLVNNLLEIIGCETKSKWAIVCIDCRVTYLFEGENTK